MAERYPTQDYRRTEDERRYDSSRDYGRGERYYDRHEHDERGFIERASDEVRSWIGDEEAMRRRRIDNRFDEERYRESGYSRGQSRREHHPENERACDLMTRNVIRVRATDSIEHAARLMAEGDCGALPVVSDTGRLIGIITDRDIAIRAAGRGLDPRQARVGDCMSDDVVACHEFDSVESCMRQMSRHQVRRLPIVDDRDRVVGMISQGDLARHAGAHPGTGERRAVADVLYAVSEPTRSARR